MLRITHSEIIDTDAERFLEAAHKDRDPKVLHAKAEELARSLTWLPNVPSSHTLWERGHALARAFKPVFAALESPAPKMPFSDDFRWLYDHDRLLYSELQNIAESLKQESKTPHVRTASGQVVPQVLALAEGFLEAVSYEFSEEEFTLFVEVFQQTKALQLQELWTLVAALRLVLLEQIAVRSKGVLQDPSAESQYLGTCVRSLREIGQTTWKEALEPLIGIDRVLRQDPAGAYAQMDFESRDNYRKKLSNIAKHSDCSELKVAEKALALALEASRRTYTDPRIALRESHVGYYVVDTGLELLQKKVGFRAPFTQKIQALLQKHPDEMFVVGIEILTVAIMSVAVLLLTESYNSPLLVLFSLLVLLLPSSQSAVQLINYLVTSILPAEILPKLDFEDAIPDDCVTLVAIPSLLLNEKQVRGLVDDLEVRFLGNHDPNIHFALLTDLPDSREPAREDSPLITLCSTLIRELNEKYSREEMGSFLLFHRHRVYNPREKAWMGWERKRGKLLDLNNLLRGQYDSFPVKIGHLDILPRIRFVITLDSDTELPRGTAHRMIGALAHPLNRAIIDPEKNIVVAGYGILQPRVGVSVQSTARSRLAAIYAGETGFDIYTRAISDAYQDLYREGSFTGKGIYEVDAVHRVLDKRFPRNSLLSHDLIEGAYARAGLASDIEVIEDYPSHYSAHNRRKHRWLRGDWQIVEWLFPQVLSESLDRVPNPISLLSRWKIFDNLRRSLVEPATFVLLVAGWFIVGRVPWHWTLAALVILFIPTWFQFAFALGRALFKWDLTVARDAVTGFYTGNINLLFTLIFLPHQTLLSLDAVVRTLVRRFVTQQRLLEWETAAEAELGSRERGPGDTYLNWIPVLAIALGIVVWALRPKALAAALPILILWACSKLFSSWLNRSPVAPRNQVSAKDVRSLRRMALHTWRYFAEFSTAEHNWLVPDNVQEQPAAIAARVSPTNIGLLLNARQVACEFGYLTVPEFAEQMLRTLATVSSLKKYRGHVLNWYDSRTLQPMPPQFVSAVDSGNLLASLWTLRQGCLERLDQPVLQPCLAEGFLDCLRVLGAVKALPRKVLAACEREYQTDSWLNSILNLPETAFDQTAAPKFKPAADAKWFAEEAKLRLQSTRHVVSEYAPWCSPEFAALRTDSVLNLKLLDNVSLEQLPEVSEELLARLEWALPSAPIEHKSLYQRFHEQLAAARANVLRLIADLRTIAEISGKLAEEMDFKFLLNTRRKLVSVGFDVEPSHLHPACYDLLGTESRTAVFVAIAKEDIPQESWFLLGRAHTLDAGRPVLLSWTGTLFEYLMPSLWMRSFPNTLLERSRVAAVHSQQTYAARKGVPWGISESAYFKLDDSGNYQYYAFGLPHLALRKAEVKALVISPYSTFLALGADPSGALSNLRKMDSMEWFGAYGFYEAADFTSVRRRLWQDRYQLVRCWMAHHQGMSLLALANFLNDNVVQKWFHAEPRVQATELLLHEKPVAHVRRRDIPRRLAAV
ncbi:MAG TPA: glucoamylase family protein [Candidatus Sulfotelmatobacter sp.]|nr:glucoamylase family protein [Candidatus Sulfotelmatobacter sp.]